MVKWWRHRIILLRYSLVCLSAQIIFLSGVWIWHNSVRIILESLLKGIIWQSLIGFIEGCIECISVLTYILFQRFLSYSFFAFEYGHNICVLSPRCFSGWEQATEWCHRGWCSDCWLLNGLWLSSSFLWLNSTSGDPNHSTNISNTQSLHISREFLNWRFLL